MKKTLIDSGWTIRPSSVPAYPRPQTREVWELPAQVPGHVHLDLVRARWIEDPFRECAEGGANWIDELDWTYQTKFEFKPTKGLAKRELQFAGLDTVASIYLNDELIAQHDNFFCPLHLDVTDKLLEGENSLKVVLKSAVKVGEERRRAYLEKEGLPWDTLYFDERAFVRKPGYMSGWDWGPRLVSCGIWAPVTIVEYASRIRSFEVLQTPLGEGRFKLTANFEVEGDFDPELTYNGRVIPGREWEVSDALWWPNGEGEQNLQTVTLSLPGGESVTKKIGLRTIELVRNKDEHGTSFEFVVNGRPIWTRGANWIPNDSFPSRITAADYHQAAQRYAKLGMNMLRVWGGGLYETEDFYDACDENGLLVWQDFPFACSYYPDDEAYQAVIAQEAEVQIKRLRSRTSLALWCGNNENRAMYYGRWADFAPPRYYGENLYDRTLKEAVAKFDPSTDYIESSPLLVKGMPGIENPTQNSDDHYWEVWHGKGDWAFYKDSNTRFCSEFGFASSCSESAWKHVSDRELTPEDPSVRWHDKTGKPWDVFKGFIELHYPESKTLEEWIYYSQLNQRDAMRAAVEHYRRGVLCRGSLIWQINDCWPVQSWAMEDYLRLLKPAGFELERLYAPVLISAEVDGENLNVWVANDSPQAVENELRIEFLEANGNHLGAESYSYRLTPTERALVATVPMKGSVAACSCPDAMPRFAFKGEPKDLQLPLNPIVAEQVGDEIRLKVPGLALDLVVTTDTNPHGLKELATGLSGARAISGTDLDLRFRISGEIGWLKARSLAGLHEINLASVPTFVAKQ